jgi:hypothetical protein
MSSKDFSVSTPTEGSHRSTLHPPSQATTTNTNTHTTTNTTTPPSFMHTPHNNPLYTKLPLPPVSPDLIWLLWNNTNALQIEEESILAASIANYLKHRPMVLGLIETWRNFRMYNKTTKPLQNMVQAQLNSPAKIKLVTGSYQEDHTASNLKQPSGVCQLMLGSILSLHKISGSDDLGQWVGNRSKLMVSDRSM